MTHLLNYKAIFSLLAGLSLALPAASQLHENISVDGRYVPDVIRIDRINAFPKALKSSLAVSPLSYESKGVTASFAPSLVTLPATGWRSIRSISDNPGYLELGVGSWLNSTLSAGYRFIDNSSTLFGVRLQHNSTSLWKPGLSDITADVKQYRYDESVGLYASQIVKGLGRLDASLDYHFARFNYYGFAGYVSPSSAAPEIVSTVPSQTLNDVAFRVDWRSLISPATRMVWNASAHMRHFAYRNLPLPPALNPELQKGVRETNIGLEGGIKLPWDNGSSIGLDANLDLIFLSQTDFNNYGMLTLTPYYRFSRGLLDIRLGADIDLSFKAGEKGHRFPFIHVAPDVRFGLQTGQLGVYLDLLGGSELMTLSRLHQLDYYGMPALSTTRPSFSPIDAAFGVNLGPFSGFSLGLKASYKSVHDAPLGGWYTTWLNYGNGTIPGLLPAPSSPSYPQYCLGSSPSINLHGYSLSGQIGYEYGSTFGISAEGSYQPQNGKKGFFNGFDRPKITGTAKMYVRPIKPLKLGVSYDFRGKRAIYTTTVKSLMEPSSRGTTVIDGDRHTLHHLPLPDLTLLNFSASWDFSEDFSIWMQADNLLNRHDPILPMQPTQGIVIVGGIKWLF